MYKLKKLWFLKRFRWSKEIQLIKLAALQRTYFTSLCFSFSVNKNCVMAPFLCITTSSTCTFNNTQKLNILQMTITMVQYLYFNIRLFFFFNKFKVKLYKKCDSPLVRNENTSNNAEYNSNSNDSSYNVNLPYTH